MADIRIDPDEIRPLLRQIVSEVLGELDQHRQQCNGRLALTEAEAAELLGLHPWQLRDLRLDGKISFSRIVGNKVRYTPDDLRQYLQRGHDEAAAEDRGRHPRR